MKKQRLGQSDLLVSEISMGCMSLENDVASSSQLIHRAIELGINFFDTADLYDQGRNEELLGLALQNKRTEVVLATKVGNEWNTDGKSWRWNPSKAYIISSVEESLRRLKTDYIDLYQLHGGTLDDPIDESIEAFERLKKQGKIRYYGISSIRPNVIREYIKRSSISSVMMQYSLLDRRSEEICLDLLHANDISVITRGTLAKGLLAGKAPQPYLKNSQETVNQVAETLHAIAQQNGQSNSFTACQYVLATPAIASAAIGYRTVEQLEDCLTTYSENELKVNEINRLREVAPPLMYENHR